MLLVVAVERAGARPAGEHELGGGVDADWELHLGNLDAGFEIGNGDDGGLEVGDATRAPADRRAQRAGVSWKPLMG